MRDVLYISDIDNSYHYVDFSDDCIYLFNQPSAEKNELVECYKIYYKISPDTYKKSYETMQEDTVFTNYNVSNSFWARKDIGQFSVLLLTVFFIGIFLINIITSCVKKRRYLWGSFMKKIFTVIKKIIKKYFLVALLVIVFVLSAITSSYGAFYDDTSNYEQDPTYLLMNYYDNINTHFIKFLLKLENNSETAYIADVINRHDNFFIEQTGDVSYRFYYLWKDNPSTTSAGTYTIFNNQTVPCSFGPLNYAVYYDIGYNNGYYLTRHNTSGSINVPTCYIGYINDNIYQWSRYRLGYKDLDSISAMLTTIISTQETGNDLLNSINNKIQSVDNSINNDDTTGISTNIIADNPLQKGETEGFFEGFYQSVVTAFTDTSKEGFIIPLGFVNQNIIIRGDLLSRQLSRFTDTNPNILDLIHLFWYFTFGIYIFKDIQKYKDDFKSGEVLNKTDTNITTEML